MRVTAGSIAKRIKELRNFGHFSRELDVLTGIKTRPNGSRYVDLSEERLLTADSHSWAEIGEAVVGRDVMRRLKDLRHGRLHGGRWEAAEDAGAGAMGPSQFQAINYWSETTARVLEALQLVQFQQVEFITSEVTTLKPGVVQNIGRRPRYSPPTSGTPALTPNQPIPMGSLDAEWIDVHPLEKHGQGLAIATETMLFDGNQGAAVDAIGNIAYQIGWSKEDRGLRAIFGIENTYRYGAADSAGTSTSYNTYYAASDNQQWTNKLTVDLLDETSLDAVEQLYLGMKHPRTNLPINMDGKRQLIVTPAKIMSGRRISRITTIEQGPRATAPAAVEATKPTWVDNIVDVKVSQRARDLMTMTQAQYSWTGLTNTQAGFRFVYGDPRKAFEYREARPFQSWSWNMTQDPSLALHDCFMIVVAIEQGSVTIVEPRHVVLGVKDS